MNNPLLSLILLAGASQLIAEDHYYILTVDAIRNSDSARHYVKSEMNEIQIAEAINKKECIIFPQSYAYMIASDKWEVISKWDDLRTGCIVVNSSRIVFVEKLQRDPVTHEPKDRVFKSIPIPKSAEKESGK